MLFLSWQECAHFSVFQFCWKLAMTKVGEEKLGCFKNNQSNGLYSFSSVSIRKPCLYLKYVDINFSPGISYSKGPFKKVHTLGWGGGRVHYRQNKNEHLDGGGVLLKRTFVLKNKVFIRHKTIHRIQKNVRSVIL